MSNTKWTVEQKSVIDSRNGNILVAAAAGSGKTAVLVERIIQMITDEKNPTDINKLLVVTFTNAAAAEMKERVQLAIEKLIQNSNSSELLKRQLVLLNDAKITTIHSFCLNVIENYYYKIPIEPSFRIASEEECSLLKINALNKVFEQLYLNEDTEFLNIVNMYGSNRGDSTLREIIMNLYSFVIASPTPERWLEESSNLFKIDKDFNFLETEYGKSLLSTISIILQGVEQSFELIIKQTHGIPELESYYIRYINEHHQIKNIRNNIQNDWDSIKKSIELISYENYQKGVKRIPKTADEYIKELKDYTKSVRDDCKETIEDLYNTLFYRTQEEIESEYELLYPTVSILSRICKDFIYYYQKLKKEANIIDFNDIEHFALKILTTLDNGELTPSNIAKEYSELFDEIFIDEYQDSSLTQEVILSSISKNFDNRFMVGDVKQSIYKFRQARPDIFLEKYNSYSSDKNEFGKKILLHKNFRSRKEVLDATNFIFEHIMSTELGGLEYGESERLNLGGSFAEPTDIINSGGPAEVHLIHREPKVDINEDESSESSDEDLDKIQIEARVIGNIIKDITDPNSEKSLHIIDKKTGKYRVAEYRDIVILLRSTTNWEEIITNELVSSNISISSESSSKYFDNYEVRVILATLKAINNFYDDISLMGTLRSPIFSFSIDEIIDIRNVGRKIPLYECLKLYSTKNTNELAYKCIHTIDTLNEYFNLFKTSSLEQALSKLFDESKIYLFIQALSEGEVRKRNLDLFLHRAKSFNETNNGTLTDFINYLDTIIENKIELPSALNSSKNTNSVKIMTIHKSKGLEFPIVICAGLGKKFNNLDLRNTVLTHSDLGYGPQIYNYERGITYPSIMKESIKSKMLIENLSEEMRVLYVALTRPKEKLYLVGTVDNLEKSVNKWAGYSKEAYKIPQYAILKSNTYLDWIVPSILKHPDLHDLRTTYKLDDIPLSIHDSKWKCKLWDANAVTSVKIINEHEENIVTNNCLELNYLRQHIKEHKPIEEFTLIPNRVGVTESIHSNTLNTLKKPTFSKINNHIELTGLDRGRIVHEFLYRVNLNHVSTVEQLNNQLDHFISKGYFSKEEANMINMHKIHSFFTSELGQRLLSSKIIKREQEISSYLSADKVTGRTVDSVKDILVKGIIDIYFEEEDNIILIDYKTDDISKDEFEKSVEQYKRQVSLYKAILEKLTGKNVKESYLYLFSSNEYIKVTF